MPQYDRGDPPQSTADVLRFLREELQRIEAFTHAPRTDGAWEDLRFPATGIDVPGPSASPSWDPAYFGLSFAHNATNDIQCIAQLPHSWREGTNIRPHIHWEPGPGFTAGRVVTWLMIYRWRNNGEAQGALTTLTASVTLSISSTLCLHITSFGTPISTGGREIDGTNKDISSILDIQIARVASAAGTTATAVAILKEFDIHYLTDSFGSDKEYVKGEN